jgi:hypothetical protein
MTIKTYPRYRLTEYDLKLLDKVSIPLILDFTNRFNEKWVGEIKKCHKNSKNKDKYKFFTLISIGENLSLRDLGYNDEWAKRRELPQTNIEFIMTKKNLVDLRDLCNKKLKQAGVKNGKED